MTNGTAVSVSYEAKVYFLLNYILQPSNVSDFPGGSVVKNPPASAGDVRDMGSIPGWRRSPGGRQPTPVFLPRESHGQKSLVGYSP